MGRRPGKHFSACQRAVVLTGLRDHKVTFLHSALGKNVMGKCVTNLHHLGPLRPKGEIPARPLVCGDRLRVSVSRGLCALDPATSSPERSRESARSLGCCPVNLVLQIKDRGRQAGRFWVRAVVGRTSVPAPRGPRLSGAGGLAGVSRRSMVWCPLETSALQNAGLDN